MPRPSVLTYNELDGLEVREILEGRVTQAFDEVPYFKKHLTLPRVKMTLKVTLEIYADQPNPERLEIGDSLTVVVEGPQLVDRITMESVDSAAPGPGGHPPDQIREMHGLPTSMPSRGDQEIGAHISIADQLVEAEGDTQRLQGVKVTRDGAQTNVTIDQGPAGLRYQQMNREPLRLSRGVPPKKQ